MACYIGLMSGTSIDAIDGVVLEFAQTASDQAALGTAKPAATVSASGSLAVSHRLQPLAHRTLAFASQSFDPALRAELEALQAPGPDELARAALAANRLADAYAEVIAELLRQAGLRPADVAAVGAHGQTVRHRPELGYTIQLLNAPLLAERCGIAVVADLRSADVAAGGQGAPLVPAFHAQVFGHASERRAIVNIGGIANLTVLPAAMACEAQQAPSSASHAEAARNGLPPGTAAAPGTATAPGMAAAHGAAACPSAETPPAVLGYDTGPGNTLLDAWCRRHTGAAFDRDGDWARKGEVDAALLAAWLGDPYFALPAPKSTGRDHFNLEWLQPALSRAAAPLRPQDVQATLLELSAETIARACRQAAAQRIFVCGGGAHNRRLMERLGQLLAPTPIDSTAALGIDPQAVEASAFAWLAARRHARLPGNLPSVTGARGARILGVLAEPPLRP